MVYVGWIDWEKQLNKFDALIAQLAVQNVYLGEKVKQSMLIRSLPESLSFLWTVASVQPDMTVETLEALIRAELNRKKNSKNLEGLNHNTRIPSKANQAKNQQEDSQKLKRHGNKWRHKKGNSHYYGICGYFKRVRRKRLQDQKIRRKGLANNAMNSSNSNNLNQWNILASRNEIILTTQIVREIFAG